MLLLALLALAARASIPDEDFAPYAAQFDWSPVASILEQQSAFGLQLFFIPALSEAEQHRPRCRFAAVL